MESITAFPPQPNFDSTPSWKMVKQDMELSQLQATNIKTLAYRAFAAMIWAYTGDKTVSFVAASCSPAGLEDIAVHQYQQSGIDLDNRNLVHNGSTSLERVPSSRSILIQLCDNHANRIEQLSLPQDIVLQLFFQVTSEGRVVQFEARFDELSLDGSHVESYMKVLTNSVKALQICTVPEVLWIASKLPSRDVEFIKKWNGEPQRLVSECIHDRHVLTRNSESSARTAVKGYLTSPLSVAFYIFTSGSSGVPKTVEMSHAAFVTSCEENNQLASVLNPNEVSSTKELMLLGEPIQRTTAATWLASETTILRHGYGQSEAGGQCCDITLTQSSRSYRVIGNNSHLNFWIVDPFDHNRLMPVGAVGELLLEGHSLATGYYKEPALTAAVFISAPSWAHTFNAGTDCRRWYKTGDLVQYQANGGIVLYGRKDFQLKVNGQRVESTDVEHYIKAVCPDEVKQVVVDKLGPEHDQRLVVIVKLQSHFTQAPISPSAFHAIMHQRLKDVVPAYMIPAEMIFTEEIPKTATGKLHRRALRQQLNQSRE
ncbi:hypothetical protein CBER1_09749 [Cercospora berteroae]|uniref:AMP-dependent synthetase/ligase domain-containing protein n=1 Tax=Cercospora berteroae TaxID=357750 RepID=A0A2S6BXJ8_9PEZI|nr:hypothetical protein CBER1_09749 [Cercospora berteroae]